MTEPDLIAEINRRKKLPVDQRGDMRQLKRARNRMARRRRASKAQTT